MRGCFERIEEAVAAVRRQTTLVPQLGIVLESAPRMFLEQIAAPVHIGYEDLPHFPSYSLQPGKLILGTLGGMPVVALSGGDAVNDVHTLQESTFPVRVAAGLGIRALVVTGSGLDLRDSAPAASVMVVKDHINYLGDNPLIGLNDARLGPRFPDMSAPYSPELIAIAETIAGDLGIDICQGVYAAAELRSRQEEEDCRFLREVGADAAGSGIVPDVIVGVHAGLRVAGLAMVSRTNWREKVDSSSEFHSGRAECSPRDALFRLLVHFVGCLAAKYASV